MNVVAKLKNPYILLTFAVAMQAIFLYLIGISVLPIWFSWVTCGLLALSMLLLPLRDGLVLFVLSVPFFVALPNPYLETLNMWRPLVLLLVIRGTLEFGLPKIQPQHVRVWFSRLLSWEKLALLLVVWAGFTLLWASFPFEGLKQIIFILNAALLYPLVVYATRLQSWQKIFQSLKISTGVIVALGFVQLFLSLIFEFYYFWQGWASNVAPLYFGPTLSRVFAYSNSWLAADLQSLRVFSVMASSHAYAVVCVFFLAAVIYTLSSESAMTIHRRRWLWAQVALASMGIVFSGTRGVWVGTLPVLAIAVVWMLFAKGYFVGVLKSLKVSRELFVQKKAPMKAYLVAVFLLVFFIFTQPFITIGLAKLRYGFGSDSYTRAISIVDLDEASNAGRLFIWKYALREYAHRPLGVGFDNFISILNTDNKPLEQFENERNKGYNLPQRYITAHNLYLQLLVELSVVGLGIYVWMWVLFFKHVWAALVKVGEYLKENDFLVVSAMLFIWLLSYSFFDLTWLNDKILIYTFVWLALVRVTLQNQKNE